MGHSVCKGATTGKERKSLLTGQLYASDSAEADDTCDHHYRYCQHPLLSQARAESDSLLLTTLFPTDLDCRNFPVRLHLVSGEDGHRLCTGNWNSSQIIKLAQVVHHTGSYKP